jgi:hypothetical protein
MDAVECATVEREAWRTASVVMCGVPQLTTMRCWPLENSNDKQLAVASAESGTGGHAPTSATRSERPASTRSYPECGAWWIGWLRMSS